MDWMEAVSNRWTDRWMQNADKNLFFRSFVLRPEENMDRPYILRCVAWLFGILMAAPFFACAVEFFALGLASALMHQLLHLPTISLESLMTMERRVMRDLLPGMMVFVFLWSVLATSRAIIRAYFWNRRALRLRLSPLSMPISMSGVWPPPPRI